MKEKLMEILNQKLRKFLNSNNVIMYVISYRYGEVTGIINTMREINMLNSEEYSDLISTVDHFYNNQLKMFLNGKFGVGKIK